MDRLRADAVNANCETVINAANYALGETLRSGQAFRWREAGSGWEGVVNGYWVRLSREAEGIRAAVRDPAAAADWAWLRTYLQTEVRIEEITAAFPSDPHLAAALEACPGLRLLRQDPWECLASFILSSTKQIVQIQQIVRSICERFGERVAGAGEVYAFPGAAQIAGASEASLRACKMGFRAPYLKQTAALISDREIDLGALHRLGVGEARAELMRCPGVGRKIADCVLLFAYGFQEAFPVDVWILKALRQLYFPRRKPSPQRLLRFTQTYFGPNAGYAQQYLFHYMRTHHHESVAP